MKRHAYLPSLRLVKAGEEETTALSAEANQR
jgi:hypothetical protein